MREKVEESEPMSTITRERLEQLANFRGAPVTRQEEQELARIALERMDAKAVAWTDADELRDVRNRGSGYLFAIGGEANKFADPRRQVMLYTAPPAPIVPKELQELLGTLFNTDGRRGADFDLFDYLKARDDIVSLLQRNE